MDIETTLGFGNLICYAVRLWWLKTGQYPWYAGARGLLKKMLSGLDGSGRCRHGGGLCQRVEGSNQEIVWGCGSPWHSVFTFMGRWTSDGVATGSLTELERSLGVASYPMNWPIEWEKPLRTFTIFIITLGTLQRGWRFASLDGDKLFANNHSMSQVKRWYRTLARSWSDFSEEAILFRWINSCLLWFSI